MELPGEAQARWDSAQRAVKHGLCLQTHACAYMCITATWGAVPPNTPQGWRIWDGRIFSRLNYSIMLSKLGHQTLLHHPITTPGVQVLRKARGIFLLPAPAIQGHCWTQNPLSTKGRRGAETLRHSPVWSQQSQLWQSCSEMRLHIYKKWNTS